MSKNNNYQIYLTFKSGKEINIKCNRFSCFNNYISFVFYTKSGKPKAEDCEVGAIKELKIVPIFC